MSNRPKRPAAGADPVPYPSHSHAADAADAAHAAATAESGWTTGDDPAPPNAASLRLVPAVERAVRLLDLLARSGEPQPLSDLCRQLSLPKSSVHGLLTTLTALGLTIRGDHQTYSMGPRVLQWAGQYSSQSVLVNAFNTLAAELAALNAETMMLAVLDGSDVVYLACRQGNRPLAVNFRVGGRFPACCTSSGKAIMATLPQERVRQLMADGGLRRLTRHSVTSPAILLRQLDETRLRGFAIDDEETAEGMYCFGAGVFGAGQPQAVAAVAVSLIKASATPRRSQEIIASLRALAERLSARLGGDHTTAAASHDWT